MKLRNIFNCLMAAAVICGPLTSCSDDDPQGVPENPDVEVSKLTARQIVFSWHDIEGVNQYGYELAGPDGKAIDKGVTDQTSVSYTDLEPATTYTLTVWSYYPIPGNTPSGKFTLTATTGELVQLRTPSELSVYKDTNTGALTASFAAVPGATYYHYEITGPVYASGDWTETVNIMPVLTRGDYTISVWADSDDPESCRSEAATATFTVTKAQLEQVTGLNIWQALDYYPHTYIDFNAVTGADQYLYNVTGTENVSGTFTGVENSLLLLPGNYTIELTAVASDGSYDNSLPLTESFTVSPANLKNPSAESLQWSYTGGTLSITWDAVDKVEIYWIYVFDYNTNSYVVESSSSTNSFSQQVDLPAGNYEIWIQTQQDSDPYYSQYAPDWLTYGFTIQ